MVGVIILNFNTANDVLACVKSVKEKTSTDYKIYIVDNCSTDNSAEVIKNNFLGDERITLLFSQENRGFSAGNNIGIKKAIDDGCDVLCVTNSDILLINDAITILKNKIEADNSVGVIAPSIHSPNDDKEAQFARNKLTFGNFLAEKTFLKHFKGFCKKYPRYIVSDQEFDSDFKFFGMTYGCFYVAKASFFVNSDFLDEDVFLFNEEDIMAYKLENLDLKTMISPEAIVLHNHHSSINKTSCANRVLHFRLSELIVLRKYAKVSMFWLSPIIFVFKLNWLLHCVKSKDFRNLKKRFFKGLSKLKGIKIKH